MVYVFVFMGEFGVELLNWQGVVRKLSRTVSSEDTIVCCSRGNVYPFYETADHYIDISEVDSFKQSQASGYCACLVKDNGINYYFRNHLSPSSSLRARNYQKQIELELKEFIVSKLIQKKVNTQDLRFIYSSKSTSLNGCKLGIASYHSHLTTVALKSLERRLTPLFGRITERGMLLRIKEYLRKENRGAIYEYLDTNNNEFVKIQPDLTLVDHVEKKLGWSLNDPYILCQTRRRDTPQVTNESLPQDKLYKLFDTLIKVSNLKIILLSFDTGRKNDSYSKLSHQGYWEYSCDNFAEQACLIDHAEHCLFFTEGDLGSHIYVPPLMGKDVTMVAPKSIYDQESAPITFWNREVFLFGGQIFKGISEDIFPTNESIQTFSDLLYQRINYRKNHSTNTNLKR